MQRSTLFAATLFCVVTLVQPLPEENRDVQSYQHVTASNESELSAQKCAGESFEFLQVPGTGACSFGYYCSNGSCQCRKAPNGTVKCNGESFAVLNCYCASTDRERKVVHVGPCIYVFCLLKWNISEYVAPNQFYQEPYCKYILNKTGTLCGRCLPGHYSLAYTYDIYSCIPCPHVFWNWVRYITAAYLPLTLLYLVIVAMKINVVSSHLNPMVLFSQAISFNLIVRALTPSLSLSVTLKIMFSLYGIWNLDFFRPFYSDLCLGIGILPTLALDYVIAVYPLLLMIISYLLIVLYDRNNRVITIIWMPFQVFFSLFKRRWAVRASLVDAFSTFFLLSNIKFLNVSFDLLTPTRVYHLYGDTYDYTYALYYSGDIEYFGREHLPYGILAIVMLCVFVILPVAILALYPFAFFQKFLNLFPVRWYILHTFVDSFQGCYKDGTEQGTRDCRLFSVLFLICRPVYMILFYINRMSSNSNNQQFFPLCPLLILLFLVIVQPYKQQFALHYKTNSAFVILYAGICTVLLVFVNGKLQYLEFFSSAVYFFSVGLSFFILGFMLFSRCRCSGLRIFRWWHRNQVAMDGDGARTC